MYKKSMATEDYVKTYAYLYISLDYYRTVAQYRRASPLQLRRTLRDNSDSAHATENCHALN